MVRLALLAVAASYASISYAGPIIIAPAANASAEINPQHASHALEALPPSPPVSAPKVKRSALSTTNEDPFSGTRRQYLIHVTNPVDGKDIGVVSMPGTGSEGNDDDDLITFDPSGERARRFAFGPGHQEGKPFEMSPADDGGFFGRRGGLLAAVGRGKPADLASGSPNFANLGIAREAPGGLLNLNIPLDTDLPARLLSLSHGSPLTKGGPLPAGDAVEGEGGAPGLALGLLDGPLDGEGGSFGGPLKKLLAHPDHMNEKGAPQTAIWTLDPATKRLNARYRNSNGEAVPGQFVTGGACQHFICLTADVNVFRQVWGEDATEIHLAAGVL